MRPTGEMMTTAPAMAAPNITHFSPPPDQARSPCNPQFHDCKWWPYSNSSSFGINTAMILIVLLCALTCALALNTAIRCFLRGGGSNRHRRSTSSSSSSSRQFRQELEQAEKGECGKGGSTVVVASTVVYTVEMGGDCAICLSEFEEGEEMKVLGKCKHGFHIQCIEKWLCGHTSCPVCRTTCLASNSSDESSGCSTSQCCPENATSHQRLPDTVP